MAHSVQEKEVYSGFDSIFAFDEFTAFEVSTSYV